MLVGEEYFIDGDHHNVAKMISGATGRVVQKQNILLIEPCVLVGSAYNVSTDSYQFINNHESGENIIYYGLFTCWSSLQLGISFHLGTHGENPVKAMKLHSYSASNTTHQLNSVMFNYVDWDVNAAVSLYYTFVGYRVRMNKHFRTVLNYDEAPNTVLRN